MIGTYDTENTGELLDSLFGVVLPHYNMGQGLANVFSNYDTLDLCLVRLSQDKYNMVAGKASLDKICELLSQANLNESLPCCQGN